MESTSGHRALNARHILLSAYACSPTDGSEPGVGWQILKALLRADARVTVVTRENNVRDIRRALSSAENDKVRVVGHDWGGPLVLRMKKRLPLGTQVYYWLWQLSTRRRFRELSDRTRFDVAHHVTFAVDWMPVGLAVVKGPVTKVWGPVGGSSSCPPGVWRYLGYKGIVTEILRKTIGTLGRRLVGRRVASNMDVVIAQNGDEIPMLKSVRKSWFLEPNALIDLASLPSRSINEVNTTRILGVGRLLPWKGWILALDTLRHLPPQYTMEIYGEGPDRKRIEAHAKRWGLSERVVLHGVRPRHEVLSAMATARCLLHPSFHESAPGVVGEAFSVGCPVIGLDAGGTGEMVRMSGGDPVQPEGKPVARRLAEAVDRCDSLFVPVDRWRADRLEDLLSSWYGLGD